MATPISPELFKRTRYFGLRAADPGLAGLQTGAWWYNTVERRFKWFDGTMIRPIGRFEEDDEIQVVAAAGDYVFNVTIAALGTVEYVHNIRIGTDPVVDPGTPTNVQTTANVVGFTLMGVGGGTTLTAHVMALGRIGA